MSACVWNICMLHETATLEASKTSKWIIVLLHPDLRSKKNEKRPNRLISYPRGQIISPWRNWCHLRISVTFVSLVFNIEYWILLLNFNSTEQPNFLWCSSCWDERLVPNQRQTITELTHWGLATHICVGKLTIIGSDNGLSPGRRQAIIWTIAGILLIGPLGTNFSKILIGIQTF